jgi:hypothetical protein
MLRISDSVRHSITQDGAILLDVHRGQVVSVNVTGARILELVLDGHDESQIVDQISQAYGADKEVVRLDVVEFLDALGNHHILQSSAEAGETGPAGRIR